MERPKIFMERPKILLVTPIPYDSGAGFWDRDSALLIDPLKNLGFDAHLVALGALRDSQDSGRPLILVDRSDLENVDWWRNQNPWAVFFLGWALIEFNQIRRSVLSVTPRLIERLDTDGNKISRLDPFYTATNLTSKYQKLLPYGCKFAAAPLAVLKTTARCMFKSLGDESVIESMSLARCVAAESPLAVVRTVRGCSLFKYPIPKVVLFEHPIDVSLMGKPGEHRKDNLFVSVGRWDDPKKNPKLLLDISRKLLALHPDWKIRIVGRSTPWFRKEAEAILNVHGSRFIHDETLTRPEIAELFSRAKICVTTSLHESFSNSMSEALCCGATVVGWQQMAGMHYLASLGLGTMATSLTSGSFIDALALEVTAWNSGVRDSRRTSEHWQSRVSNHELAARLIGIFKALEGRSGEN